MDIADKSVVVVVIMEHHMLTHIHTLTPQMAALLITITLELVQEVVEQQRVELKPTHQLEAVQSVTKCSAHTQVIDTQAMVSLDTMHIVQVVVHT